MKKSVLFAIMLVFSVACTPHKPTVTELRAQKKQRDSLNLCQQERAMAYTDSLLQVLLPQSDSVLSRFRYVKNGRYEDAGHYVSRQLETAGLGQRTFLQAYVSEDMRPVVRSFYFGSNRLEHGTIILSVDSMKYRFVGQNYSFESEGVHEILTITNDEAVGALKFIDYFSMSKIRVTLVGKGRYTYVLNEKDKRVLLETLHLHVIMSDIKNLETQHRQAALQVAKYRKRLEK